jgi:Uma2 family endonuclease
MATVMSENYGSIHIPPAVRDVDSFCRWIDSSELPEKLPVHFLRGEVWVDASMEELFTHNRIKTALGITLGGLIEENELGLYITDGMRFVNKPAGIATEPDAMFVSNASLESKRVRFTAGKRLGAQATRAIGSPDLFIEVVSDSTAEKDTDWLLTAYHEADVREYWLIDARDEASLRFDILRWTARGYSAVRKVDGWLKSAVLGTSFRLVRRMTEHGYPRFRLDAR